MKKKIATKNDVNVLVGEITCLALIISRNTPADVFIRYSGHVDSIDIDLHLQGWDNNTTPDIRQTFGLKHDQEDVIFDLKKVKNMLKKIAYKEKINWKVQPYYIESIKRYTFS